MIAAGLSWLVYWLMVSVFSVASTKAALITFVIFIALGLLLGERPWERGK